MWWCRDRGVQPGRQDPGLGDRPRHDQVVGRGNRKGTGYPPVNTHFVLSLAFSPDGRPWPGRARRRRQLWDLTAGKERATLSGMIAVSFRGVQPRRQDPGLGE